VSPDALPNCLLFAVDPGYDYYIYGGSLSILPKIRWRMPRFGYSSQYEICVQLALKW
jgi:hypothetical protein